MRIFSAAFVYDLVKTRAELLRSLGLVNTYFETDMEYLQYGLSIDVCIMSYPVNKLTKFTKNLENLDFYQTHTLSEISLVLLPCSVEIFFTQIIDL